MKVSELLRQCRTFDPVGDIDGPWAAQATALFRSVNGITGDLEDWERDRSPAEIFAAYDKAIAAAEAQEQAK